MCVFVCVAGVKGVSGEEVRECSRKSHLLSAHSMKCQDMVSVIHEFSKRIRYRIQVLRYALLLCTKSHDYHMTIIFPLATSQKKNPILPSRVIARHTHYNWNRPVRWALEPEWKHYHSLIPHQSLDLCMCRSENVDVLVAGASNLSLGCVRCHMMQCGKPF